jgi:abortive infection bacteriophage resistance protein
VAFLCLQFGDIMPKLQYNKSPLTFDEQITQLTKRGVQFANIQNAKIDLQKIGYYRLSGYWYVFRQNKDNKIIDDFLPNTNWSEIIQLYEFDRKLRLLVLDAIERFEINLRTQITYHFSHKYGAFGYLNKDNFHNRFEYDKWFDYINKEIQRNKSIFVNHFRNSYSNENIPIWMATEIMSFGSLSRMYFGMKHKDKQLIDFGIHRTRLVDWIKVLVYIRNICAHHSRLWNIEITIRASRPNINNWDIDNHRIFYILLMLRHLNQDEEWKNKIENLIQKLPRKEQFIKMMGMPNDWQNHQAWR